MVGYDVPHVSHDMALRFMGVNFSAIADGSARIPSSVGDDNKPAFLEDDSPSPTSVPTAKTPQQDKAMWEGASSLILANSQCLNTAFSALQRITTRAQLLSCS